ncbi:MAG: MATE family efflux transporter [Chitinophagaceae bacterium]|nr:MATE family efflux transporter [Chitinophagaceae bacterium]
MIMRGEVKQTIHLAVPIIIGELAQMSLHIIDSAMVGEINYRMLAATSLVLGAVNIPFVLGIGMTISVSQMVSMANGRRDAQLVSHYLFNGFILCTLTAIIISLTMVFSRNILYHLGQDEQVVLYALPFMKLISISLIPMLLFMTLKQFCDGLEYTRTAMLLSLLAIPLNIFFNWLLIYGHWGFPRLELVGAGWATLITRSIIFIILLAVVLKHRTFKRYIAVGRNQWKLNYKTLLTLLRIGIPSGLQIGMEAGAFAVTSILVGTMGAVPQASHQIALACASFTFMVSMGLSQAGSIRVSNAFGQNNWPKISAIGKSTLLVAVAYGVFCAILFTSLRWILPTYFTDNTEVIKLSALLLLFAAVFQISDSTQSIGAGLLRGIKDVRKPTWLIGISYWVIGIPVGYFCGVNLGLGAAGMWLGLILGLTFSSIFLITRFLKQTKSKV